ncbi:DNA topoisomerase III [Faecalibacterium prausnitzii]|mgnify:FL=1|uniref:DNA topoisomerase n=1 Tax=Faecalibacterium prausnitzii TaxID=853 RepID=A0A329UW52_9FIRM|nr:DNA topoisomerase 3 [Faecalibacterium prausnitzii]RAW66692.1 DNA topoisomerase III [Faecalibacterium prausnitzii]
MKLVLAEKPSVAMSLSKVTGSNQRGDGYMEGNGYLVSWCVGHLVELSQPEAYDEKYAKWKYDDLPILPEHWQYQVSASTKKQFGILKKLMQRKDVESLICATDAGREGELIFRLVYHQCGCKKPVERLWISSMEDSAIREGFQKLRPGTEYDALYEAALCRERADWIVGINATRLFSCLYGQTLNVGRVMTPTLAMVVMRDAAIRAFKPEPFYSAELKFRDFQAGGERMKEKAEAEKLVAECCQAGSAIITKVEQKEKSEKPPALFDLTSLQREANRQLGFTAQQTLDYTQALYEKKLVTYPRTDSRYLTDDMAPLVPELVSVIQQSFQIQADVPAPVNAAQVINSKKVTDHHAIIPTKTAASYDISSLPSGEQAILTMLAVRLICAVGTPCLYAETVVEAECAGQKFRTKGKTATDIGWRRYAGKPSEEAEKNAGASELPELSEGMTLELARVDLKEGKTSPPKRFTEDLLLSAMESASSDEFPAGVERKGIGTPATRAAIIEKLVQKGFIERRGDKKTKYLCSTDKGNALVTVVPEQIQSPSMTADWEEKLLKIEHGEYDGDAFMGEISSMVSGLVKTYEAVKGADVLMQPERKVIGSCPACGSDVCETAKGWFCRDKNCKFALWKENRFFQTLGKQMTEELAKQLVNQGKARLIHCYSRKSNRYYDTTVHVETGEDGAAAFKLEFGGKK